VEVVRDEAQSRGLTRLGLVGTLFTMQGRFYADVLEPAGITVVVPSPDEQACIHETYMRELVRGLFRAEGRDALLRVAARLAAEERVEGVILGGTELPLLLKDVAEPPVPLLDTTRLHAERIAAELQ
jgi:aspartate racemase